MSEAKKKPGRAAKLMRALSTLSSRISFGNRAGLQYEGKRDLYAVFGYKKTPSYDDYLLKYLRQAIAGRIIDAPVNGTWSKRPAVFDSSGPDGEWAKAWQQLDKERNVFYYLERADRLAGIGQFSVLLIGAKDGKDLEQPLSAGGDGEGSAKLIYLQPYSQGQSEITSYEGAPQSERFGLPIEYQLTAQDPTETGSTTSSGSVNRRNSSREFKVHYTRVLHVADTPLQDEVFGVPRLQRVYNVLDDLLKVVGGSAEMFWLAGNRGMQADVSPEMELDADDAENLEDEIDDYIHELSRVIKTRGVTLKPLGTETADPRGNFEILIAEASAGSGIPSRILLGSERGQLASQQDRSNWANRLSERQGSYATPSILQPFAERLIGVGVLPEPKGDLIYVWADPFAPSPLERAQTMAQRARATVNLTKALDSNAAPITKEEARAILGFERDIAGEESVADDLPDDLLKAAEGVRQACSPRLLAGAGTIVCGGQIMDAAWLRRLIIGKGLRV